MSRDNLTLGLMLAVASVLTAILLRRVPPNHRPWMWLSLLAHFISSALQFDIVMGIYGGADTVVYFLEGRSLASLIERAPSIFLPLVLKAFFQLDPDNLLGLMGGQSSTGSMSALAGLLQLVVGESFGAMCFAVGFAAFVGKVLLYSSLRDLLPKERANHVLVATMLVPSVVYWSSVFAKESVVIAAIWAVVAGFRRFFAGSRLVGVGLILLGAVPIGLFKPYVLFAFAVAGSAWWFFRGGARSGRTVRLKLWHVLAASLFSPLAVLALGQLFPRFAMDNVLDQTSQLQEVGSAIHAGSNYATVDPNSRGLIGQLVFAPWGLFSSLFRPALFDISGAMLAIASVESTALTALFARALARGAHRHLIAKFVRSPVLAFGVAFTLVFGTAVGVASTNLGTLFRYRAPMVPFYALSLLALPEPRGAREGRALLASRAV